MLKVAAAEVARLLVVVLAMTWRVRAIGREHPEGLRRDARPFVFALWHGQILPLLWYHRGVGTLLVVGENIDGGYLARAARAWGYGLIRGSSSRGSFRAFRQMLRTLQRGGEIAVTPDGPRGPARTVSAGAVAAAQLTGASIVPVAAGASSAWRLRSWDGFIIPKPFARVQIVYDAPLSIPPSAPRETARQRLQGRLQAVSDLARC